ncbi:MAG: hypothetical protein ACFE8U_17985 [Candidatus Hermodarchaeota archaeon]
MYFYPRKVKYPTDKQLEIWELKRTKLTGKEIAAQKEVTPGFVSKTLTEANQRIKGMLENAAHMNKITIDLMNEELGFARGQSHMFNVRCYITFSPKNSVQVWYEHKGDCVSCEKFTLCREILLQEFKERNLQIEKPSMRPTDLVDLLFQKLEEMVK